MKSRLIVALALILPLITTASSFAETQSNGLTAELYNVQVVGSAIEGDVTL